MYAIVDIDALIDRRKKAKQGKLLNKNFVKKEGEKCGNCNAPSKGGTPDHTSSQATQPKQEGKNLSSFNCL